MPYIKPGVRHIVADLDRKYIFIDKIENAGEIQYAIALMLKSYIERKKLNYQNCNDLMGALAGAQMEFYRRTVAPYEDKKKDQNGDIG